MPLYDLKSNANRNKNVFNDFTVNQSTYSDYFLHLIEEF